MTFEEANEVIMKYRSAKNEFGVVCADYVCDTCKHEGECGMRMNTGGVIIECAMHEYRPENKCAIEP